MNAHEHLHADASTKNKVTDPVCGMQVDPASTAHHAQHAGQDYHFCSARCLERFVADPEKYITPPSDVAGQVPSPNTTKPVAKTPASGPTAAAVAPGAQWTCPMHPQIVRDGPGACPICGMALEPMAPSADDSHAQAEIAAVRRKLWISVALTTPVFLVAMVPHMTGWHAPAWTAWLEFVLGSIVVLWAGASFFQRFWTSLRNRSPNMYTLIGVGVGVAWLYSVIAFFAPSLFPAAFHDAHGRVGLYFEAAAVIITLVL
ncbi:MAG: YHS domain-containing protein, partial [Lysobacteraceae bacterium]